MPNWITNRVVAKDFNKLQEALIDKETGKVDFNILKPLNDDLHIAAGCGDNCGIIKFKGGHAVSEFGKEVGKSELVSIGFATAIQGKDVEDVTDEYDEECVKHYFKVDVQTFKQITTQSHDKTIAILSENGFTV